MSGGNDNDRGLGNTNSPLLEVFLWLTLKYSYLITLIVKGTGFMHLIQL